MTGSSLSIQWLRRASVAAASLVALFALYKMEGSSFALPIWALCVLLSAFIPGRLPNTAAIVWLLRFLLFGFVVLTNLSRTVDVINMFDPHTMTWVGEFCAAELALASWLQGTSGRASARPLWLSGLIILAASSTPDDAFMVTVSPAYFLALLVAVRWSGTDEQASPPPRPTLPWRYGVAVACALLSGAGASALLTSQRAAITMWGMRFLGDRIPFESGSLSLNPNLTSTFGQRGSLTRAMRIEGGGEFSHMRGVAYTTYDQGTWGPRMLDRMQDEPITTELEPNREGAVARVTRLLNNHGIVFTPLNAAGLRFADATTVSRVSARGGMLRTGAAAPSQYDVVLTDDPDFQGPLCVPPTAAERARLLIIPNTLDPRVRLLSTGITGAISDPHGRIDAIERYLISHHQYSLRVDIGRGDPVSNFLLQRKSAHCEYFASAAVILARLAGVPSRYIIGYLAHEREGNGVTIVRQRDAHAWAECWLEGKGWVVLDATPGDGRPDALKEKPSPIAMAIERLQDLITSLKLGAHSASLLPFTVAMIGIVMLAVAVRALWELRAQRRRKITSVAYESTDAELVALFREYERLCRANGLICPPGQTWSEFLSAVDVESLRAKSVPPEKIDRAKQFIALYNPARFGRRLAPEQLEPLRVSMAQLKSSYTARTTST